jgi:hypothetical protein
MRLLDREGEFVSLGHFVEVLNRNFHADFLFFAYTGININDGTYLHNFVTNGGFSSMVENERKIDECKKEYYGCEILLTITTDQAIGGNFGIGS